MGQDARAVVDARLRVRGVDGLRVIDASIMPNITSGNTNAPTQALARHATAMLVDDLKRKNWIDKAERRTWPFRDDQESLTPSTRPPANLG
jgi:choline dehydrogenase-like flavoprotein